MKIFLKQIIQSIVVLLFCYNISNAQTHKKPIANTLLWEISKEGQLSPSYLFGTIHLICEEDYFWTAPMQRCFDQCKQVGFEMDISNTALSAETASLMIDFSGSTLRDYFTNEQDYNIVRRYIEVSLGQNIEIVERMKPVALYLLYSIAVAKGPCANTVSYELKLLENAKDTHKSILGLESLEDQIEALESMPTGSIITEMIRIARGENKDSDDAQKMVDAYKKQDINLLQKLITNPQNASVLDTKVLVDERNRKWLKPMEKAMLKAPTFFAVGAGHVYGLLQLLREAGYKVSPIIK